MTLSSICPLSLLLPSSGHYNYISTSTKVYICNIYVICDIVNLLLFVMYQFSSFSSVPSMTNLCTDKYKYHRLHENISVVCDRKYYHTGSINLYCILIEAQKVTRIK